MCALDFCISGLFRIRSTAGAAAQYSKSGGAVQPEGQYKPASGEAGPDGTPKPVRGAISEPWRNPMEARRPPRLCGRVLPQDTFSTHCMQIFFSADFPHTKTPVPAFAGAGVLFQINGSVSSGASRPRPGHTARYAQRWCSRFAAFPPRTQRPDTWRAARRGSASTGACPLPRHSHSRP